MSSGVMRLAYMALRRRAAARRSGGITIPDLDPGPEAERVVAQALHDVGETALPLSADAAPAAGVPGATHSTRSVPLRAATFVDVDTVTETAAVPSSVTLTQRVAVA